MPFGFNTTKTGKVYETAVFKANGEILRRNLTEYYEDSNSASGTAAKRDARPVREISLIFEDGATQALASQTVFEYDSHSDPAYRAQLNIKRIKSYNFVPIALNTAKTSDIGTIAGMIPTSALAKMTETDYLYSSDYLARNMTLLPTEIRVLDSSNQVKSKSQIFYDEGIYSPLGYGISPSSWEDPGNLKRGQITTTRSFYDIPNNQYIETHAQTDQFGQPRKMWDGKNNLSQIEYDTAYYTYPIKSITPKPDPSGQNGSSAELETITNYDPNTGLTLSVTDTNGQTTEINYADPVTGVIDPLLRIRKITASNGHQTIKEYGAGTSASTRYTKIKTQIDQYNWKEGYSWYDGLGRTIKSQSVDSNGDVFTETQYDNMGRAKKATNPYRSGETIYWTENFYDDLSRLTKVKTPDNAEVNTVYSLSATGANIGTVVTVTDQAGKLRRSITNGLGQLERVDEPDATGNLGTISSPNQATIYSYDTLNNLTTVSQDVQTRTFQYDSLSRLKQATNPESGLTQYQYDNNGNLTQTTDARGVITTHIYDDINRIKMKSYSNEPTGQTPTSSVVYYYDGIYLDTQNQLQTASGSTKGKLTSISSIISRTNFTAFDVSGRVTQSQQITDGVAYNPMTYSYNLSGALIEQKYPSGRVVRNVLNDDGELSIVQSKKNQNAGFWNYAKSISYTAMGMVSSMQLGNGKWESTQYNSRLQPIQIALGTIQNGTDKLKLNFDYGTTDNNGNIKSQVITIPTEIRNGITYDGFTATQNYSYDSLNRIKQATETIPGQTGWQQTFIYDRYGNRNFDEANTTTLPKNCGTAPNFTVCASDVPIFNPVTNIANNRLNGYTFDNAGNTIKDAQNRKFSYDGENKQIKVETVDSNGTVIGIVGEYFYDGDGKRIKKITYENNQPKETTIFVYDAGSKLVAEYSNQISQTPQVSYLTNDHLGSPRINTDQNGAVTARHDYQPFGEEISRVSYGTDNVRRRFTSYERDSELGLDYAQARYYSSQFGRFTTPDLLLNSGHPNFPRTWNRYIYALNNPLIYTDSTGLAPVTFVNGTSDQQKKFLKQLERFKDKLKDILKSYKDTSEEYKNALRAYNAYFIQGVQVAFGDVPGATVDGETAGVADEKGNKSIIVTIDSAIIKDEDRLLLSIAHEGSHAADRSDLYDSLGDKNIYGSTEAYNAAVNNKLNLTILDTEMKAFTVSSVVAEFTFKSNERSSNGAGGRTESLGGGVRATSTSVNEYKLGDGNLWNPSWAKASDRDKVRKERKTEIETGLRTSGTYKEDIEQKRKILN